MEENPLIEDLIPAVEEQLNSKDTPLVKKHFNRLVQQEQETEHEAKKMIALCLADEVNRMLIDKRSFDNQRYEKMLENLPNLPS